MKFSTCLILLLSTLLVGCKEKLATLIFSADGLHNSEVVSAASPYSNESKLGRAFEKMGIAPGALQIERDSDDPWVVHLLARKDALDDRQREMIKWYLKGIIEARQQPAFKMSLTTAKVDSADTLPSGYVEAALKPVIFEPYTYMEIRALLPKTYMPYLPGRPRQGLLCAVQVGLRPAWLAYTRLERIEGALFDNLGTPNMRGELHAILPSAAQRKVQVAVSLNIENADLRGLLNEGKVRLHLAIRPRPLSMPKVPYGEVSAIVMLNFILGTVDAPADQSADNTLEQLKRTCTDQLRVLGRPFSFKAGFGLDSLVYVTFWDEE